MAEGNQFLGEYTIAPQRLAQLGIRPGAVGYLDIKFSIRDYTSKTTGEAVSVQDIRFSKWSLANANQPAEAPANAPEPSAEEVARQPASGARNRGRRRARTGNTRANLVTLGIKVAYEFITR